MKNKFILFVLIILNLPLWNVLGKTISIESDTTKPIINHTPLSDQSLFFWPVTISTDVTDNIGVDSVWVKWYKNSTSTGIKRFNLAKTGGINWSAKFNSTITDVAINDSIFYRVFARDISTEHNMDSTSMYRFIITSPEIITIGSGTTSSNFPFTTYWKDGRTQYLYLASELSGIFSFQYIFKIGFDVISIGGPAMTDFKISYKNTTLTTLSAFDSAGFTVVYYSTSYTPQSTGWNMIHLTNLIQYTGGNLLLDICYNNTTYTSYSTVKSTPITGMAYGRYNDLTEPLGGCDYTAWTLSTGPPGRANTRFQIMNPNSVGNSTKEIPNSYSLSQNYPNPFNPTTKINFALPKQGLVTLKIYDVLGREVRTLVNEVKSAGQYSVDFNASEFSSGVYFYKLESGTFSETKRMLLIK